MSTSKPAKYQEEVEPAEAAAPVELAAAEEVVYSSGPEAAVGPEVPAPVELVAEEVVYSPPPARPVAANSVCTGSVSVAALKFEPIARNSTSVKLVQQRLMELGFMDAGSDYPGWLSVGTRKALGLFCGCVDKARCERSKAEVVASLFEGTTVLIQP